MKKRSWQKNFLYSVIMLMVNSIVPLITYPYLTRVLQPENLGRYNFAYAIAQVFFLSVQFGLPYYGAREIAKVRDNEELLKIRSTELFSLTLLSGLFFSTVYILGIVFIPKLNQDKELFLYIGIIVFLAPLLFNWFFQGLENFKYIALRNISFRVIGLVLMFLFVKDEAHYTKYGLIMAFVLIGHFILNIFRVRGYTKFSFRGINIKQHFKPAMFSLPVLLVSIALIQIGNIMVGFLSTNTDVAFYAIPAQIVMILAGIMTALAYVMVPRLTILLKKSKEEYQAAAKSVMRFSWLLVFPMCVGLIMMSEELIEVFAGASFSPSADSLRVGAIRIVAMAISGFAGAQVLITNGEEKKLCISLLVGVVFMIALDFLLVPFYGHVGAMIAVVAAEFMMGGLQIVLGKKYFSVDMFLSKAMVKYLLFSLLFIPLCILIKSFEMNSYITLLICILLCSISYIGLLLISKDSILKEYLDKIFKRKSEISDKI